MNTVIVNGRRYNFPEGSGICIRGSEVYVNGEKAFDTSDVSVNKIEVHGNIESLVTDCEVTVSGNVGTVDCGGSCNVGKNINGNVTCGGSCNAGGKITGDIIAGGSVSCGGSWWR